MLAGGSAFANDELIKLSKDAKQWVMPAGDYAATRHSTLKQITAANVGKLQVAWTFSTGVLRGHEGAPLVIGDVMYLHTAFPNNVYALDLKDGAKIIWSYKPTQDPSVIPVMCCDTVNRGLSYGDGKIFLHQADTTLVALDAKTGKVAWSVKNGDPAKGATGTSAPFVIKDKVFIGISGGEFGVQGHVTGYNTRTARWRGARSRKVRTTRSSSTTRRRRSASRSARIRRSPPGRATNGRSAAAPPGAGSPMIRR
jgi:PQQ-dependent dehydrogenase (methanol/ethanol family)